MKNPYVLKLFERFSKKDMKEFGKFVSSPYHNNRTVLIRFYAILSKYILSDSEIPSKKLLFNEMYPGKKYNADIIDKLYSFLYKLSKEFLVLNSLKSDKEFSKLRLLKCLDKYGTDSVFEKELNSTEKFIQNQKIGNSLYYWKSELEDVKSQYYNYRAIISKGAPSVQMHASYHISDFLQKLLNSLYNFHPFKTLKGIELGDSLFKHFIDNFALNKFILKLSDDNSEDNELLIYNY